MQVDFRVPFVRGKQRPRFYKRGNYTHTYTPKQTQQDMLDIAAAYQAASIEKYGCIKFAEKGEPVRITVITYDVLPQARPKKVIEEDDVYKPDIDNTVKLVFDGLNGIAFHDDNQVIELHAYKQPRKRREPYVKVTVRFKE